MITRCSQYNKIHVVKTVVVGAKAANLTMLDLLLRKTMMMVKIKAQTGKIMTKTIISTISPSGGAEDPKIHGKSNKLIYKVL